jgi:hypothetical protein
MPDQHADGGNHRAAERHLNQRLRQRHLQEALADQRDRHQLDADDDVGDRQRLVHVVDQERQRVHRPADERRPARDEPAGQRGSTARQSAVVRQTLGEAHADGGAERGGQADEQCSARAVEIRGRKDGRERRDRPVDQTDQAGLDHLEQPLALVRVLPAPGYRRRRRHHHTSCSSITP